ncbi:MAG: flagellar basal body L-ring protein FlgH [Planctomycetes bacterium]|nr:flagellar basal body L-ring protein FlgH [Planctomycetota bacterium]
MRFTIGLLVLGLSSSATLGQGTSVWERRDPRTAYLFTDTRARCVGDLLTIVVNESTEFEGQEKSEKNKETATTAAYKFSGKSASDNVSRSFSANLDGSGVSQRKFDGKANNTIDRKFMDRMTVTVVAVLPNGNLIIEGVRQIAIARERKVLTVTGIVRPLDVGPFNTVQSQVIANFTAVYTGRGPDTAYTGQGWWGRALNVLWPY